MKTIYLFTFLVGSCLIASAQSETDTTSTKLYKRWSMELGVGQNKPIRPFSTGYYSSNPNRYFNFGNIQHFEVGVRYMFNPKFGLKLDGAYDQIVDQSNSGSLPFESQQIRLGLQGIVNIGRVLNFESFTNRFGLLAHAGIQVSKFTPQIGVNKDVTEDNGGVIVGLTPQFRIANWLVVHGDFTVLNNVRQHFNWDGTYAAVDNNLTGILYNTSLGLTFYPGKKKIHADWYSPKDVLKENKSTDKEARERLDKVEAMLNDVDRDGVPDYLDSENNTPAGVAVDSRGRIIDLNRNGVPDELDKEVHNGIDGKNQQITSFEHVATQLLQEGYVNIFYDVNQDLPNSGSMNNVYFVIQYLKKNPKASIELIGYADVNGNELENQELSERRALKLKNSIISSGINASRISILGKGVDKEQSNNNTMSLSISRRVSIQLIIN